MARWVYPLIPGIHTVQIRTGRRKFAQMGRLRDFSPDNGGYTSPVFEIMIARDPMFENGVQTRCAICGTGGPARAGPGPGRGPCDTAQQIIGLITGMEM